MARVKCILLIIFVLTLAGCAKFHPAPLSPLASAESFDQRSFTNAELRHFIERTLAHEVDNWPAQTWDTDTLTLAAFYYSPELELARAERDVMNGTVKTASQKPNPTLNVTPGYNATTFSPTPWLPLGYLDIQLETAGKRRYRTKQAAELAQAAQYKIASLAWKLRDRVRSDLVEYLAAGNREKLLRKQISLQQELERSLEEQLRLGALSISEVTPVRIALARSRLELALAQRVRSEAKAKLAAAVGVPAEAFEKVNLASPTNPEKGSITDLTSRAARRTALQSRADIVTALAEYAATESALQLEIAKQYPDVHLQPGYEFDQGDSKWSLGLSVGLPILNQNQGPIAEATARRREAAARFNVLQAQVVSEIDRAVEALRIAADDVSLAQPLASAQKERVQSIAAQYDAGAVGRTDLLNAQLEALTSETVQLDLETSLQQAVGALEAAVQRRPVIPDTIYRTTKNNDQF